MPNQHKSPSISWHSADPTLKPWVRHESQRRGITDRELLDEALIEYRLLCEIRAAQAPDTAETTGDPR